MFMHCILLHSHRYIDYSLVYYRLYIGYFTVPCGNTEAMFGNTYLGWTEVLLNKTGEGEILQAGKHILLKHLDTFSTINLTTELYAKEHRIQELRTQIHHLLPQVLVKWHSTAPTISK